MVTLKQTTQQKKHNRKSTKYTVFRSFTRPRRILVSADVSNFIADSILCTRVIFVFGENIFKVLVASQTSLSNIYEIIRYEYIIIFVYIQIIMLIVQINQIISQIIQLQKHIYRVVNLYFHTISRNSIILESSVYVLSHVVQITTLERILMAKSAQLHHYFYNCNFH